MHVPDTQNYVASESLSAIATGQMQWIAQQKTARNIRFAVQVGDLVDHNTPTEWHRIRTAFDTLTDVVPYALCTGNHDCGPNGSGDVRDSLFADPEWFGVGSPYAQQPSFRGWCQISGETGNTANSWHTFRVGKVDWIVLTCEWGPRDAVMDWMNERLAAHPHHRAIIVIHAYLETSPERFDWSASQSGMNPKAQLPAAGGVNDGEDVWEKVASLHEHVCLVCCGHTGRGYVRDTGAKGNAVHQMLFNTQNLPEGGEGWLRLIEFWPDDRTVTVQTYSPHLDEWDTGASAEFSFMLSPVCTVDADADGLPDYWEARHGVSSPTADDDGDGASNADEWAAATDPKDHASRLDIRRFNSAPAEVEWTSVPGVTYELQQNTGLQPTGWTRVVEKMATDWTAKAPTGDWEGPRRFFRVVPVAP